MRFSPRQTFGLALLALCAFEGSAHAKRIAPMPRVDVPGTGYSAIIPRRSRGRVSLPLCRGRRGSDCTKTISLDPPTGANPKARWFTRHRWAVRLKGGGGVIVLGFESKHHSWWVAIAGPGTDPTKWGVVYSKLAPPTNFSAAGEQIARPRLALRPAGNGRYHLEKSKASRTLQICGHRTHGRPRRFTPANGKWRRVSGFPLTSGSSAILRKPPLLGPAKGLGASLRNLTSSKAPRAQLLLGRVASTGRRSPLKASDGDPKTFWAEGRPGPGAGEYILFRAPASIPIDGFRFRFRPEEVEVANGIAPKRLYLVTDGGVYGVNIPKGAWKESSSAYEINLPKSVKTSCVGVILDEPDARGRAARKGAQIISEFQAISRRWENMSWEKISTELASVGKTGSQAKQYIMRSGPLARKAVAERFPNYGPGPKEAALDVLDQGPCEENLDVYVGSLWANEPAVRSHAERRLRDCRSVAWPAIKKRLKGPQEPGFFEMMEFGSAFLPEQSLVPLLKWNINAKKRRHRRKLRGHLRRAAQHRRSMNLVGKLLTGNVLRPEPRLQLLAAAGDRVQEADLRPAATQAFASLSSKPGDFRSRYLLIAPAARLAAAGDPAARGFLEKLLSDKDKDLRASAAAHLTVLPSASSWATRLMKDAEPRVREQVAVGIFKWDKPGFAQALLPGINDGWTFVRVETFRALATAGKSAAVDAALAKRLTAEGNARLVPELLDVIATRQVRAAGPALLTWAEDPSKPNSLRLAATRALGAVCYKPSLDFLTSGAKRGGEAGQTPDGANMAQAALEALAKLKPNDLASRIEPLLKSPQPVWRNGARAALSAKPQCH